MKKIFTLALSLFVATGITFAQEEIDETFQFINAKGEVVPDGSTITVTEVEYGFTGKVKMLSGLSVKNTTDAVARCTLFCDVLEIQNGQFTACMFSSCTEPLTTVGQLETPQGVFKAAGDADKGDVAELDQAEWEPTAYGKATVVFQINVYDYFAETKKYVIRDDRGPRVTVNFVYSAPAGVNDVTSANAAKETARYGLDGSRLAQPTKGINLVKTADGKVRKVLVK